MTTTDTPNVPPARSRFSRIIRWIGRALGHLVLFLVIAWASLVLYYSNLPWPAGRLILAVAFGLFAIVAIWVVRRRLVRLRTDYRDEEVFFYRLRASPEVARALFDVYLERINSLADRPEWYHLLKDSCTINVIRYSRISGAAARAV